MSEERALIECQLPVSKLSKESYKERKSSQGQTITGLGKWWGRKPLILVRAAILGCLMPAGDSPEQDGAIFLKLLGMDPDSLLRRKIKRFSLARLCEIIQNNGRLRAKYGQWLLRDGGGPVRLHSDAPREEMETAAFQTLGYDEKIAMCSRPEQLPPPSARDWTEINRHLGTSAGSLPQLVEQLSLRRFGHRVRVGDCFCGGGSIPFEAARIGCDAAASDLNPVAGLLTWADLHLCGGGKSARQAEDFLRRAYDAADREMRALGVEYNERGDRALSYLYCVEAPCPECGCRVPLLPSLAVGIRAGRVVARIHDLGHTVHITIHDGASPEELRQAQSSGTVRRNALVCPHCGKSTPLSAVRRDRTGPDGSPISGLRPWEMEECEPRADDLFQERLYAIRYEHLEFLPSGRVISTRYYRAPEPRDWENEARVRAIVTQNLARWQAEGLVPSSPIEAGDKTGDLVRGRGWRYWHQLFHPRQLLALSLLAQQIQTAASPLERAAGILGLNKCADFGSRLCRWNPNCDKTEQTFYNQALNPLYNWGVRSLDMLRTLWLRVSESEPLCGSAEVRLLDARSVTANADLWITDPPYADAVSYHELSEFFLAWDKALLPKAFPDWYTDSKRVLAVRGDSHFSGTMIEIYANLTRHMPENGMQVVMFTHSDPAVWAQLAVIMWKAGLRVTAAWNIATETDASGLKSGNYVKGTVLLVLRRQTGDETAFLDEINAGIRSEVKGQIERMQQLDDKEEPNFSDPDYVLAAYAASLKVLTSYAGIEDLDLDAELNRAISAPSGSRIVAIIENAKRLAYDCVIPRGFDRFLWRSLSSAEKFYIKGLETEKHGCYQISAYQEFARGFSVGGYGQLMASERANAARLKTPMEMAARTIRDVPGFEQSLMRILFAAIYIGVREDENPHRALAYLKNQLPDYWDRREMIGHILRYHADTGDISNMRPHWAQAARMAGLLLSLVQNDSV